MLQDRFSWVSTFYDFINIPPLPHFHLGSVSLREQKLDLLIVKKSDHVVFEGITAFIVAEFFPVPHVDGLQSFYPCQDNVSAINIFEGIDSDDGRIADAGVNREPAGTAQGIGSKHWYDQVWAGIEAPVA